MAMVFARNHLGQLKTLYPTANISGSGASYLLDALDPLFTKLSDAYMKDLIKTFGTDHYYQADGCVSKSNADARSNMLTSPILFRRTVKIMCGWVENVSHIDCSPHHTHGRTHARTDVRTHATPMAAFLTTKRDLG